MLAVVDDPSSVSPGLAGFLAVFFLAIATWLLIRSMVGHLRRVRYGPGPEPITSPVPPPSSKPSAESPTPASPREPGDQDARPDTVQP